MLALKNLLHRTLVAVGPKRPLLRRNRMFAFRRIATVLSAVLEKLSEQTIILGTLGLSDMGIETPETVAARIRRALPHVPAE
jgi:hypothetical protein